MAYRYGDRKQKTLFPQSIDEYIPQDSSVRAYDIFVDSLDFNDLGIELEPTLLLGTRGQKNAVTSILRI